jgi:hypothetical protein
VREVETLLFLAPLVEREVDDPAQLELVELVRFRSSPTFTRASPANLYILSGRPSTKNTASPSARPSWLRIAAVRSSPMFLATGPEPAPSLKKI